MLFESCNGYYPLPNATQFYNDLYVFGLKYLEVHKYPAITVCVGGILANILNMIVLIQKKMRNTTNFILFSIALTDILKMLSYAIFLVRFHIQKPECSIQYFNKPWTQFIIIHGHISTLFHCTSLWLTVVMAFDRCMTVRKVGSSNKRKQASISYGLKLTGCTFACVILISLPSYFTLEVASTPFVNLPCTVQLHLSMISNETLQEPVYYPEYSSIAQRGGCVLKHITFWASGFLGKIIPSFILALLSGYLVWTLQKFKNRQQNLIKHARNCSRAKKADRTTAMLLTVVVIFVITEIPQGLLTIGVNIYGQLFHDKIYNPLGDIVDMLALLNSSINLFIYCAMSPAFRETFLEIFRLTKVTNAYRAISKSNNIPMETARTPLCVTQQLDNSEKISELVKKS